MTTLRVTLDELAAAPFGGMSRYAAELARALIATAPEGAEVVGMVPASPEPDYARITGSLPGLTRLDKNVLARRELAAAWRRQIPGSSGLVRAGGGGQPVVHAAASLPRKPDAPAARLPGRPGTVRGENRRPEPEPAIPAAAQPERNPDIPAAPRPLRKPEAAGPSAVSPPAKPPGSRKEQKLFVKIASGREDPESLRRLQALLKKHAGPLAVVLYYERERKWLELSRQYQVKPSEDLIRQIDELFGARSARVK